MLLSASLSRNMEAKLLLKILFLAKPTSGSIKRMAIGINLKH